MIDGVRGKINSPWPRCNFEVLVKWTGHEWGQEGFIQGFDGRNMRERDNFEDVGVDGGDNIMLKIYDVGVEYIDVPEDGEKWRALVSTVVNLQVP